MSKLLLAALFLSLPLANSAFALDDKVAEALHEIQGGLVVHLGATDGELESEIASLEGKFLVHALADDEQKRNATRVALLQDKLYGLASVATWHERSRLPYATNLANIVIADLSEFPKPSGREELLRIVAPGGFLFVRENGGYAVTQKERPDGMDDWGHFDHDARGLGTSGDTLVEPVRQQQWLTSLMPIPAEGNPAGYDPGAGVRISGRFCLMDVNDSRFAPEKVKKSELWELHCRDAFNGTPLWSIPRDADASRTRWALAANDGVAYAWLKGDGELSAIDLASGKILRTFPGTIAPEAIKDGESLYLRVDDGVLLVGLREKLLCFDLKSGDLVWEFSQEGLHLLAPVMDLEKGRVFSILAKPSDRFAFRGRWPVSKNVAGIIALDLKTGKPVWTCEELVSLKVGEAGERGKEKIRGVGQLIPTADHLVVFGSKAISGGTSPYLGSIDLATGKLVYSNDEPFISSYNTTGYNAILRDGSIYFAGAFTRVWKYDPASGKVETVVTDGWNQRCTRFAATPRFLSIWASRLLRRGIRRSSGQRWTLRMRPAEHSCQRHGVFHSHHVRMHHTRPRLSGDDGRSPRWQNRGLPPPCYRWLRFHHRRIHRSAGRIASAGLAQAR